MRERMIQSGQAPGQNIEPFAERTPGLSQSNTPERPSTEIITDLWNNMELLFRQEIHLARTELEQKAQQAKKSLVAFGFAGAVAYGGYLLLLAAVFLLLSKRLDPWLSALLIGAFMLATGYAVFRYTTQRLAHAELAPEATRKSIEKSARTLKEALR